MGRVICVCDDLIFATRISSTAAALDCDLEVVRDAAGVRAALERPAAMVIVDLGACGSDPPGLIRGLREAALDLRIIAYGSHVDTSLARAARGAGADEVLPRSAFSTRLPEILTGA